MAFCPFFGCSLEAAFEVEGNRSSIEGRFCVDLPWRLASFFDFAGAGLPLGVAPAWVVPPVMGGVGLAPLKKSSHDDSPGESSSSSTEAIVSFKGGGKREEMVSWDRILSRPLRPCREKDDLAISPFRAVSSRRFMCARFCFRFPVVAFPADLEEGGRMDSSSFFCPCDGVFLCDKAEMARCLDREDSVLPNPRLFLFAPSELPDAGKGFIRGRRPTRRGLCSDWAGCNVWGPNPFTFCDSRKRISNCCSRLLIAFE